MAAIGMKYLVVAPFAASQTAGNLPTYEKGMVLGRAISANVTMTRNDAKQYSDDVLGESDNSITGGSIDMTVAEVTDEVQVAVFGVKKEAEGTGYHDTDAATPYVGLGYIREQRYKGTSSFRAMWIYKAQLAKAEDTANTKQQTTTFGTERITGEIMGVELSGGGCTFRAWDTFATEAEAKSWLNTKANITA